MEIINKGAVKKESMIWGFEYQIQQMAIASGIYFLFYLSINH